MTTMLDAKAIAEMRQQAVAVLEEACRNADSTIEQPTADLASAVLELLHVFVDVHADDDKVPRVTQADIDAIVNQRFTHTSQATGQDMYVEIEDSNELRKMRQLATDAVRRCDMLQRQLNRENADGNCDTQPGLQDHGASGVRLSTKGATTCRSQCAGTVPRQC